MAQVSHDPHTTRSATACTGESSARSVVKIGHGLTHWSHQTVTDEGVRMHDICGTRKRLVDGPENQWRSDASARKYDWPKGPER